MISLLKMSVKKTGFDVARMIVLMGLSGLCLLPVNVQADQPGAIVIFDKDEDEKTIGELKPAYIDFKYRISPKVPINELIIRYTRLFKEAKDPRFKVLALHRLAQIEELFADERPEGIISEEIWSLAIDAYQQLLDQAPYQPGNDLYLYQLARAFENTGNPQGALSTLERLAGQYPKSAYISEAWFRIGEFRYSNGHYANAEKAYQRVISGSVRSDFQEKARYMRGWSQFKQERYKDALGTFITVLDNIGLASERNSEEISAAEAEQDTLRVTSLILSYLQGPDTLKVALKPTRSELAPKLYAHLFNYYLINERYQEAAGTADKFIREYPLSALRPGFAERKITAYHKGKLPSLAWQEKERFVAEMNTGTTYWKQLDQEQQAKLNSRLYGYMDELGQRSYVLAGKKKARAKADLLLDATRYFGQMAALFPGEVASAQAMFLSGEAFFQLRQWSEAIKAYHQAAWSYPDYEKRREAAYAEITAFNEAVAQQQDNIQLRKDRVEALLQFSNEFADDSRAPETRLFAANEQFDMEFYANALEAAYQVAKQTERKELLKSAWQIAGHSAFALDKYQDAEKAYTEALKLRHRKDPEYSGLKDNLAASVYSQGERYEGQGNLQAAFQEYKRVMDLAPDSVIRINAQYDAAMRAIDLQDWGESIRLLADFRSRFATHALSEGIGEKLVYAYQQNDQPVKAAEELLLIVKSDTSSTRRQSALLQAADLYVVAKQIPEAIGVNQQYLKEQPGFADAIGIYQTLIELNQQLKDSAQVEDWQRRLVAYEAAGGGHRDENSKSLAAAASWALLQSDKSRYDNIRLTLPLKKSLSRKQAIMKRLMEQLNQTFSYGISEFSTAATHMMGEIYLQLGRDIMDSQRPNSLSELELEQYALLLEEQAYPFEDKAIEILEQNARYSHQGIYNDWVKKSYQALSGILPVRYNKKEVAADVPRTLN